MLVDFAAEAFLLLLLLTLAFFAESFAFDVALAEGFLIEVCRVVALWVGWADLTTVVVEDAP